MDNTSYKIIKHIGVISSEKNGWKKELNLISWFDKAPKFDIRDWAPEREKMGKGITFSEDEMTRLAELLAQMPGKS